MVGYAREYGVPAEVMLRGTVLTERTLADPDAQIDARSELAVIGNLVRALGPEHPALGVEVGRRYHITTFGIFGFACVSSPTLGETIAFALRYLKLSFTFCLPVIRWEQGQFVADIHELVPPDVRRFLVERDVLAMHQVMSDLLGRPLALLRAEFDYPEPEYADRLAEIIGVRPCFGQPQNLLALDPAVLEQPLPQANEYTWAMCLAQCRELVHRRRARTGIAAEVRMRLVPRGGVDGYAASLGIDAVARDLNMSTRTLRRHLDAVGTSYRALLDEVRRTLAEEMLTATPLSVRDVAIRLGYAEASTFIYAFKRWTGTTPASYRRERVRK